MSRGILTVNDQCSFDELDGFLSQGIVTSYDQLTPATGPSPIAPLIQPSGTVAVNPAVRQPGILDSITSILTSGAQAYGAYAQAAAAKKAASRPTLAPMNYGTTLAPTAPGMSSTTLALLIGGGVLVVGVGLMLVLRK